MTGQPDTGEVGRARGAHRPRKRFGQNFLVDKSVCRRIVDAVDPRSGDLIVEIGPGTASLTRLLAEHDATLFLVELDRDLAARLEDMQFHPGRVAVIQGDILDLKLDEITGQDRGIRVVGNLPYNISTPILFSLLAQHGTIADAHLMLQKEVADRLAAGPGGKTYGRLSVSMQRWFRIEALFDVSPGAFRPPPRVTSTIVRLDPRAAPLGGPVDEARFADLVRRAFSRRRKTLRRALEGLVDGATFERAGVDPSDRPENLSVEEFARLDQCRSAVGSDQR